MPLLFKAFAVGLIIAIPVGPIAILIFKRSLGIGYLAGLASGIGAALADALFALMASIGVLALTGWIEESIVWFRPIGGIFLIFLGIHFFFKKSPALQTDEVLTPRYLHHYPWEVVSTFLLTLTNPLTIFAFVALFTGVHLIPLSPTKVHHFEVTLGVFCGSLLWWCLIVLLSHPIKRVISPQRIHHLMQVLAVVLIALGVMAIVFGISKF